MTRGLVLTYDVGTLFLINRAFLFYYVLKAVNYSFLFKKRVSLSQFATVFRRYLINAYLNLLIVNGQLLLLAKRTNRVTIREYIGKSTFFYMYFFKLIEFLSPFQYSE